MLTNELFGRENSGFVAQKSNLNFEIIA